MFYFKMKRKMNEAFGQIGLKDKNEVLSNVFQSSEAASGNRRMQKRKSWHYRKVISFALAIIVVVGLLVFGIPMLQSNPNTKKPEIVLSQSLLTINVCASEDASEMEYTKMNLNEAVRIHHDFNPVMSSTVGIGVYLEFIYSGAAIELTSETGSFITWDAESGQVTDVGKRYRINEKGKIFWAPSAGQVDQSLDAVQVMVKEQEHIVGLAVIKASPGKNDFDTSIYAELEKDVGIPLVNGMHQTVTQEYVDNFFRDS